MKNPAPRRPDVDGSHHAHVTATADANTRQPQEAGTGEHTGDHTVLALAARERLMTDLAHDLRSPLNGIQGWTHVLGSRLADADAPVRRALEGITLGVEQQVRLINDLGDMLQVLKGCLDVDPQPAQLGPLISDAMEQSLRVMQGRGVACNANVPVDLPSVRADPERLTQALRNLLEQQSMLVHSGESMSIEISATGTAIRVAIRSPAHDQPQGTNGARKQRERTSGVLASCLIQLQGGRFIDADTAHSGACCIFLMPRADAAPIDYPALKTAIAEQAAQRLGSL